MIPTKPIERVYIHAPGDPTVGIPAADFEATIWIDKSDVNIQTLFETRAAFIKIYGELTGDTVSVLFDFEMEKIAAEEAKMEAQQLASERGNTEFLRDFKYVIATKDIHDKGCILKKGQKAGIVCRYAYAIQIVKVGGKREMNTNFLEALEGATL